MPLKILKIKIPSDLFTALNETETEVLNDMKLNSALHYYQSSKLSMGKAAKFAGLSKYEFETILSKLKISISNLDIDDIKADLNKALKL
ncbi:hypothetical protein ES703_90173 [subsurface metagenome]